MDGCQISHYLNCTSGRGLRRGRGGQEHQNEKWTGGALQSFRSLSLAYIVIGDPTLFPALPCCRAPAYSRPHLSLFPGSTSSPGTTIFRARPPTIWLRLVGGLPQAFHCLLRSDAPFFGASNLFKLLQYVAIHCGIFWTAV